ncbi:MAG TPA: FKBP-type peptidyl-prolyl cis-trans isomerase [Solirubrobacterales bacterium]|nr:FKBP-type peptidyl-prolyl cis-trans isomerase [Solirubrobacterales bacterium]
MSRGPMLIISLCLALALAIAGCGGSDDSSSSTQSTREAASPAKAEGTVNTDTKPKVTVPSGPAPKKLEEREIVEGDGAEAKAGDEVTVQYVGVGYDSKKEFDSSWSRNEPFTFTLGAGEVIPGWDQGVADMKVGGRRELTIPANLAYGPTGSPPVIGPNETLIFVVDLLAVK